MHKTKSPNFSIRITALWGFIQKISGAGIGFLNGIILARLLEPKELGIFSILMAITSLVVTMATLGLPMLITRQLAVYVEREQWSLFKGLLINSRQWVLFASLVFISIAAITHRFSKFGENLEPITLIALLLLVPITALSLLRAAVLRGLHNVLLADIPEMFLRPFLMLVMLGWCLLWMTRIDAMLAIQMQCIAVVIAFLVGWWFMSQRIPAEVHIVSRESSAEHNLVMLLPFFGMMLVGALESQVSLYILGYRSNAAQVGFFQIANQLVSIVAMGLGAVNMPLQAQVAAAWTRKNYTTVQQLASQAVRLSSAIALLGCIILIGFAEPLLLLYGKVYQVTAPALRILAIGQFFNAISGSCGVILIMTGQQNVVLMAQSLALVVNSIAAWLLTGQWGAVGAAIAAMLGLITWNSLMVFFVIRKTKINTTILPFKIKSLPLNYYE